MNQPRSKGPKNRCAIYTRKSTEEGLDLEFNSLDAQRESAEAFVASQLHEGWECLPDRYDDGGFSGGNLDRPALNRLLEDIKSGKVDCVVVYKVDRLSRSLLDFSRIMETFDKHGVSFVSVTGARYVAHRWKWLGTGKLPHGHCNIKCGDLSAAGINLEAKEVFA